MSALLRLLKPFICASRGAVAFGKIDVFEVVDGMTEVSPYCLERNVMGEMPIGQL